MIIKSEFPEIRMGCNHLDCWLLSSEKIKKEKSKNSKEENYVVPSK